MSYTLLPDEIEEQKPSILQESSRQIGRTGARIAEQVAGLPGDILSLGNEFIARPIVEKVTGKETVPYEKLPIGKIFPTSSQFRQSTKGVFGEKAEPQNKVEKFIDDLVSDTTSIFLPGPKKAQVGTNLFNSFIKSFGSNLVKEGVQDFTGDEGKGNLAKLGSLFFLSFFDKKSASKAVSELYKPVEQEVSRLSPVSANKLENNLNLLKQKVSKGTLAPSEQFVVNEVDSVLGKIKNGKISPEEAWASKRSLSEKLSKILYETPKTAQPRARKLANGIQKELDDVLESTQKQNPKFYKDLKKADQAFSAISNSNIISRFIENNLKYSPATAGLLHLIAGPLGKTTAGLLFPYEVGKVAYRMAKSPELAKHYAKVLGAAAKEDAVVMNRELKALDKGLQKDSSKDRFSIID